MKGKKQLTLCLGRTIMLMPYGKMKKKINEKKHRIGETRRCIKREIKRERRRKMQDCEKCIRQRDIRNAFKIVMRNIGILLTERKREKTKLKKELILAEFFIYIVNISGLHLSPFARDLLIM